MGDKIFNKSPERARRIADSVRTMPKNIALTVGAVIWIWIFSESASDHSCEKQFFKSC
jgi:hypothetical protein